MKKPSFYGCLYHEHFLVFFFQVYITPKPRRLWGNYRFCGFFFWMLCHDPKPSHCLPVAQTWGGRQTSRAIFRVSTGRHWLFTTEFPECINSSTTRTWTAFKNKKQDQQKQDCTALHHSSGFARHSMIVKRYQSSLCATISFSAGGWIPSWHVFQLHGNQCNPAFLPDSQGCLGKALTMAK